MSKLARALMGLLAAFCVLFASCEVLLQMNRLHDSGAKDNARKEAIGAAKQAVDLLYARVQKACENKRFERREEIISRLIAEQNAQGKRLYAFDAAGFYTAHYNRHYLGDNAYFERDENGRYYMQELAAKNGSYVEAKIPWQSKRRHIITYAREDAKSGVIIGATVDLSSISEQPLRALGAQRLWFVYVFDAAALAWVLYAFWRYERRRGAPGSGGW